MAAKVSSIARHRDRFKVDIIPELNLNNEAEFEDAMEVLLQSNANYVLVVSRPDKLSFIVEKVNKIIKWRVKFQKKLCATSVESETKIMID